MHDRAASLQTSVTMRAAMLVVFAVAVLVVHGLHPTADHDRARSAGPIVPIPIELPAPRPVSHGAFATASECAACHSNAPDAQAMRDEVGNPIAPFDLWRATMMANSFRDPFFRAVLEVEIATTEPAWVRIENQCLTCHAPMAATAQHHKGRPIFLSHTLGDTDLGQLAQDGVSCTVCHQIKPDNFGMPEGTNGGFEIDPHAMEIGGPHENPVTGSMARLSGYTPVFSDAVNDSNMCATCHTLVTETMRPDGEVVGHHHEQAAYLEWLNSAYSTLAFTPDPLAQSCQSCHTPRTSEAGQPIRTRIARSPNGDDDPDLPERAPVGRHVFVGGNTLIPAILRDYAHQLRPNATAAEFDAVIAATRDQLRTRTATVEIEPQPRLGDQLRFAVTVTNFAGHKFPTGYPSRRAWLRIRVDDANGVPIFVSGAFDRAGQIVGVDGQPMPFELPRGPIEPHHTELTSPDQVQIYEAVLADESDAPTFLLLRAAAHFKDNRLLPIGWSADFPEEASTKPVGAALDDESFTAGADRLAVRVDAPESTGPYTVTVTLLYQPLAARSAAELFRYDRLNVVSAFRGYYEQADRAPELVAETTAVLP